MNEGTATQNTCVITGLDKKVFKMTIKIKQAGHARKDSS